jgi:PAS domain S-box-containing protein
MKRPNRTTGPFSESRFGTKLGAWPDLAEAGQFFGSMTLKARVVLLVVLMLVAGIWGLALSVTLALQRDLMQMQSANLSAEVVRVTADLDRDVQLHIDVLARLAASLTPEMLADPAKLDHAVDEFAEASVIAPYACFVANANGIIIAGYPQRAVDVGASVAELGYFREVIAGGTPVIGVPVPGDTEQEQPFVPIAVPVRDGSGATVSALVGHVLLSNHLMLGQIQHSGIGARGYLLVFTTNRLILGATDPSRIMHWLPPKGVMPLLDRRLEEKFEGAGILVNALGVEQLSVARTMATTGWIVVAAVPTKEMFAPIEDLKRWVYLAALLISLAMAAILRFFLVRQFAPLKAAGGAIRRMTQGEVPMAAIPVTRNDEIGELLASFNRLVTERGRLEQSLQDEIIKRKQANEALRESRDRLEGIYLSVGEGIISIDAQQRIVLFNSAAERIFGYAAAEMIGQPVSVLLPERFRRLHGEQIRSFDSAGQTKRAMGAYGLVNGLRRCGEEFPLEAAVSQSGISPNKLFTVILRDITERRRAEQLREQLMRQLELLSVRFATAQEEERGKIAYELHEELGQELTALKFYLQMLGPASSGSEAKTPREQALAVAVHATERVRKLVLDLEPPELADFGLHAAVPTYCQRQAVAGGWNLHIDSPTPDIRAPRAVERACFSVLQEGLSNVLNHAQATEVWVDLYQDAGELELMIRDNGIGFDRNAAQGQWARRQAPRVIRNADAGQTSRRIGGDHIHSRRRNRAVRAVFPLPVDSVGLSDPTLSPRRTVLIDSDGRPEPFVSVVPRAKPRAKTTSESC